MADGADKAPSRHEIIHGGAPIILHEDGSSAPTSNIPLAQANLTDDSGLVAGKTPTTTSTGTLTGITATDYSTASPDGTIAGSTGLLEWAVVNIDLAGSTTDNLVIPGSAPNTIINARAIDVDTTLTGIANGVVGQRIIVRLDLASVATISLLHDDGASSAVGNRFHLLAAHDLTLTGGSTPNQVELVYMQNSDGTTDWYEVSREVVGASNQAGYISIGNPSPASSAAAPQFWNNQQPGAGTTTLAGQSAPLIDMKTVAGAKTVKLPAGPIEGEWYLFYDRGGQVGTNHLTIGHNGYPIDGVAADLVLSTNYAVRGLIFDGDGWHTFAQYPVGGATLPIAESDVTNLTTDLGNKQPLDSDLTSIAALATTAFGRGLLTLADAAAMRTSAGTVIGTDVQAYDAELAALAGLVSAADKLPYFTGSGTAAVTTLSAFIRTLLDDADAATALTTLGAQASGATAGGDLTGTYPNPTIAAGKVTNADLVASTGTLANTPPGRELTYNEFTSPVTVSATAEASATTIVTATAFTFDGSTPVIIEFYSMGVNPSATSGDTIVLFLFDGGSSIGRIGQVTNPSATITAGLTVSIRVQRRLTPSNASHTYSIRAVRVSANGTVRAGAAGSGTDMPGYIRITKA